MPQVPANEALDLGGAISSLVASGLPLEQGLRAAASELPRGRTARALTAIAERLERGEKLDAILSAEGRRLPEHLRALIVAGLRSASMGRMLHEFVGAERHAADVQHKIMIAVSYPALLLLLMSAVFCLFCFTVLPGLMALLEDFDVTLPTQTRALDKLARSGYWMLIGNVLLLAGAWIFLYVALRVAELRTLLIAVPVLGPVVRWAGLARFSRLLALLIESRLPLPEALAMAGRGCQEVSLDYASRRAAADMRRGMALSDALLARRPFPPSLAPMIRWSEQAGPRTAEPNPTVQNVVAQAPSDALADALLISAEMFERRLEIQLGLLRVIVPPLSFLFVIWGVLYLLAAISLPLVSLIEKLS